MEGDLNKKDSNTIVSLIIVELFAFVYLNEGNDNVLFL
jgi:hypothetical protein